MDINSPDEVRSGSPVHAAISPMAYRFDIDGLRALAIMLVVAYHVWGDRVSGGVDVFLMISAFFLTSSLVRRAARGDRVRVLRYLANRFRQLLPAAAVTILGVLVATYLWYPQTEWPRIWRESWASLFYYENWELAYRGVDYYAVDGTLPSPLQHFWSLSIQGQVFVLFPVVIALLAWVARRKPRHIVPLAIGTFSLIFVASLTWSIIETSQSQTFAYFDTLARLWEFAAGALVGLLLPKLRVPPVLGAALGWLGLAGIISCGLVLDVQGGFPGYLALWPILSAAAVIIGGVNHSPFGPSRFLSSRPLRFLGRDAYALYLVHWPVLITWRTMHEGVRPDFVSGLLIVGISFVLARILTWAVYRPLLRLPRPELQLRRGILVCVVSLMAVAWVPGAWQQSVQAQADVRIVVSPGQDVSLGGLGDVTFGDAYPGAAVLYSQIAVPADIPIYPSPVTGGSDWVDDGIACVGSVRPSNPAMRGYCKQLPGAEQRDSRIVVIGDSRAVQFASIIQAIAERNDLGVIRSIYPACPVGYEEKAMPFDWLDLEECARWRDNVRDYVLETRPRAVYLPVTSAHQGEPDRPEHGIDEFIEPILDAGIDVIALRSGPRFDRSPYVCALEAEMDRSRDCAIPVNELLGERNPLEDIDDRAIKIDLTPWMCPYQMCIPVVGNVAVYFDPLHLSKTYGATLGPILEQHLVAAGFLTNTGAQQRAATLELGGRLDSVREPIP